MNIPNNSLTEEIKEIVALCEELSPEYGEDASWFLAPVLEDEIIEWEHENKITIPESYKEWLFFSREAQIRNMLAHFYEPSKFILNAEGLPEDFVIIADLIGDGECLCFSKSNKNFVWVDHGNWERITDFKSVLREIIRMLKPKSSLSPEMEDLLIRMVNESKSE